MAEEARFRLFCTSCPWYGWSDEDVESCLDCGEENLTTVLSPDRVITDNLALYGAAVDSEALALSRGDTWSAHWDAREAQFWLGHASFFHRETYGGPLNSQEWMQTHD